MVIFLLIFLLLLLVYTFLIEFYRQAWNRMPLIKIDDILNSRKSEVDEINLRQVRVSVVVAMRNEMQHVRILASYLRAQTYPADNIELIFVNDHSTDDTWFLMDEEARITPNLKLLSLPQGSYGKKMAIQSAIKEATGELIITTDADCYLPPRWIETIVGFHRLKGAKFIAAPVKMTGPNNFWGIFQKLDFLTMQGITGASVNTKFHCMCNGANLAYEKRAFQEVGGFTGIDNIPSGDDMLLMYKIFTRYPEQVFYLKSEDATVFTPAEPSWKQFLHQRIRWASKAVHYHDKKVFYVLLLTYLVNVFFIVFGVACVIDTKLFWLFLLLLLMKIVIEFPFVNSMCRFFKEPRLICYFPFLQPLHIVYVVISGWLGRFGSYQWKSRIIQNKGRAKLAKQ